MISYKRRNTLWLAAMSILTALLLISSGVAAEAQILVLGAFMAALVASFVNLSGSMSMMQTIQQHSPLAQRRMSPTAREALAKASTRPGYYPMGIDLADIGMIASQTGQDGMAMRRTRSISKDDDGVRPFVVLNVPSQQADRNSMIRFEVIDQTGKEQYVYEMSVFLRDGEVNVLADTHLPLMKNDNIAGMGEWDLRVYVDGSLMGVHNFALTASYDERRRRLNRDRGQYYITESEGEVAGRYDDDEDESPVSLEDLLRSQGASPRNQTGGQ